MKKRTRNIVRKDITDSIKRCKSTIYLEIVFQIAEIFRKVSDEDDYKELTELQWKQRNLVTDIMLTDNVRHLEMMSSFLHRLQYKKAN